MMKTILLVTLCIALCASATLKTKSNRRKHEKTNDNVVITNQGFKVEADKQHYMYRDSIIYQDVIQALQRNVIQKYGAPVGWDETTYAVTKWNGFRILNIGSGIQSNQNGLLVNVPVGYDVLWFRVLSDRWATFRIRHESTTDSVSHSDDITEIYACGYRKLNEISPDGAAPDAYWNLHQWCAIPLRQAGKYIVHSDKHSVDWISGVGFSKNLWNHAMNSAVAYHWALNGGSELRWHTHDWNNDQLASIDAGKVIELKVPVIANGRNKLVYLVEHNNNWLGTMHGQVRVNGQTVERFRTSYDNAFATHFNGKIYDRYMATLVPATLIPTGARFITLTIDMTNTNHHLHIREAGTHDYI